MHGWRLGKFFGINVEINYTWLIIFGLVFYSLSTNLFPQQHPDVPRSQLWLAALVTTLLFFASLLLHELAHSVMARHLGMKVARITLFIFGGVSQMSHEPRSARSEFLMAIVGPLTSLFLAGVFYLFYTACRSAGAPGLWTFACGWVAGINALLAGFNMLPAYPLDGGRVLRSALWAAWNNLERATRVAATVGQFFGYAMIAVGVLQLVGGLVVNGLWLLALGWLLTSMASSSYQRVQIQRILGDVYVHDLMSSPVATIPATASLDEAARSYFLPTRFTAFGVEDAGRIVGMVRMDDISAVPQDRWPMTSVSEVAKELDPEKMTIAADKEAVEAMMQMAQNSLGRLLVTDYAGAIVGIISQSDIFQLIRVKGGLGI
jgi:Zn-dependent protease/CBS domain-containing protein